MKEEWKAIKGYEGFYEISNLGNVKSLKRNTTHEHILKPYMNKDGYLQVHLSKNGKCKVLRIHRLVADSFVNGHTDDNCVVNHKNEIKTDNRAENLEWCNVKYNTNYNGMSFRRMKHRRKPIKAIKGDEVICFSSVSEAAEKLGVTHGNISSCLMKKYGRKTIKGYRFEYELEKTT